MAEEFCGTTNWWDSTPTNSRFDGGGGGGGRGGSSSTSSTTTVANNGGGPGFGWLTDGPTGVDTKMDSSSIQLVGLGLSSQAMVEWKQQPSALLRNSEKVDDSFRSMLQEGGMGLNTNFEQDTKEGEVIFGRNNNNNDNNNENDNSSEIQQWREKLYQGNENPCSDFKQIGRGFSLDSHQPQFSPSGSSIESTVTCQGLVAPSNFQLDSTSTSSVFGSPSSLLQGLNMGGPEQQQHQQQQLNNNFQQNYFGIGVTNDYQSQLSSSWAKDPQFLRASSPKQQHQLQFINNTPYWNASSTPLNDMRPSFFSSLQGAQLPNMPTFEQKPKTTMEVRDTSSMAKKSNSENNPKRTRDAASSTLTPFKVRKEKMGDRITALQQLVSPFGKTDTASVLSEAIEYIKFLHEQISVLSNPYLKSGGSYQQHQQSNEKTKIDTKSPKQDLRSRGLCLVPVSSTFPVTHETTVDFWTPTFRGTFR